MKNVELLSPAGDFEGLKMAVFGGANAVYFGAKGFNARAKANNFGEDLKDAVAFCHMYGVKTYLTLNTIVENDEINDLIKTATEALEAGIDAFIVQDFGVVNILKNCFKNVEIHASTQMAINNYLGAIRAKELGIKRVVLSRETGLEDIKLIKQKTGLEIEYFIQGALCVCLSGNCYLSSKLFGKSGNRGECLQPCRLPYKAIYKGKELARGYLLSAKDMNMSNKLKDLIEAGVDSFKIEGRLRRPAYIAATTKVYRKIIDNNFKAQEEDKLTLKKVFNRGNYTEGYLNGNGGIIYPHVQGHIGTEIGSVIDFKFGTKFNTLTLKSNHEISKGDVIKFIKDNIEQETITAMDVKMQNGKYLITTTKKIPVGSSANLIVDCKLESEITSETKKLPVNFVLEAFAGEKLTLYYSFRDVFGKVEGEICEKAQNQPLGYEDAKAQLSKLGDTYFALSGFELKSDGVFVRKQELNALRNKAIETICNSFYKNDIVETNYDYISGIKPVNFSQKQLTYEISEGFDSSADILIIRPHDYLSFNYKKIKHKNAYLYVPSFLSFKDIEVVENILNDNKNLGVYSENIAFTKYKDKKIILGAKLNIRNAFAIKELMHEHVVAVIASPELSSEKTMGLSKFFNIPVIESNFDNFDLMTLIHCPIKMLFNSSCANCKYVDGIIYQMDNGKKLRLNRYKIKTCQFVLKSLN